MLVYIGCWVKMLVEGEVGVVEILLQVVNVCFQYINWYGLVIVDSVDLVEVDVIFVVVVIEVFSLSCILVVIIVDVNVLVLGNIDNIGYKLKVVGYSCMFWQYSFSSKYVVILVFGCVFMVNFIGNNIMIILKFKIELGVMYEMLMIVQVFVIDVINGNVYVYYVNDIVIIQQGVMVNGDFFDEWYGLDWLQNYVQINFYNLFYILVIKILQIDVGVIWLMINVEVLLDQVVNNGFIVLGVWNGGLIGQIEFGDILIKGYYVYVDVVVNQV